MKGRERNFGPAWTCFRADFRRRWRGRSIARTLGMFVLIAGLQAAVSLGAQRLLLRLWATYGAYWLFSVMGAFGLYSPLAVVFADGFGSVSPKIHSYLLMQGVVALPWLACHFLMPAYAAGSIAPDREQRRIPELILAGLTPRQILLAKGLAAVLPFLVVGAAALVVSGAVSQPGLGTDPVRTYLGMPSGVFLLLRSGVPAAVLLLSAAMLVCISALSRRTVRAFVLCYSIECLFVPILYLIGQLGWQWAIAWTNLALHPAWARVGMLFGAQIPILLLQAVALLLLWPRALRALADPDEAPGATPGAG